MCTCICSILKAYFFLNCTHFYLHFFGNFSTHLWNNCIWIWIIKRFHFWNKRMTSSSSQSSWEAKVEMFRFYLQWSKVVQYAADSNEGNQKLTHIQNYDKWLDMEKHPFITIQFVSIYFIHYDCVLSLGTRNCLILSRNLNHCELLLSFN